MFKDMKKDTKKTDGKATPEKKTNPRKSLSMYCTTTMVDWDFIDAIIIQNVKDFAKTLRGLRKSKPSEYVKVMMDIIKLALIYKPKTESETKADKGSENDVRNALQEMADSDGKYL